MKKADIKWNDYIIYISLLVSFLLAIHSEIWGRRSVEAGLSFLWNHPFVFLINVWIIFLSMIFVLLFRRRFFYLFVATVVWLAIGITNGVMLGYRNTPFTFVDIELAKSGLLVMPSYMSSMQMVLLAAGIGVLFLLLIWLFFKAPKYTGKRNWKRNIVIILSCYLLYGGGYSMGIKTEALADRFGNLNLSYKAYGVPYCFTVTFFDNGIRMPLNYSSHTMKRIENKINSVPGVEPIAKPNIIFLQLESFFDVNYMKDLSYSTEPLPFFKELKENYTSGFLKVPTYGAGTVNTEFEVITGMNRNYFGAGEYPYKSILQKEVCESLSYNLKELGYYTHAVHNNTATFYDRLSVFSQLGFDAFISEEYMDIHDRTISNWALDSVLVDEIENALNSTKEQDLIYAISVEGHGEYPSDSLPENPDVLIYGMEDDEKRTNSLTHYVNQIHSMDYFLRELVDMLLNIEEETILVLYGDHLPSINFQNSELINGSIYETEYVIWNNFDLPKEDENLEAYQLSAKVLEQVGIQNGILTKYHQNFRKDGQEYLTNLKLLEYDMLYGKKYIYGKKVPYQATELKMGSLPVKISRAKNLENGVLLTGSNFTSSSQVYVNGKKKSTSFLNRSQLLCDGLELLEGDEVMIMQETKGGKKLSQSEIFVF